jgi:hypothetical protein
LLPSHCRVRLIHALLWAPEAVLQLHDPGTCGPGQACLYPSLKCRRFRDRRKKEEKETPVTPSTYLPPSAGGSLGSQREVGTAVHECGHAVWHAPALRQRCQTLGTGERWLRLPHIPIYYKKCQVQPNYVSHR